MVMIWLKEEQLHVHDTEGVFLCKHPIESPKEWTETIGDEVITTALMDCLLYRCEIIKLSGESYRMRHRKTIFDKTK